MFIKWGKETFFKKAMLLSLTFCILLTLGTNMVHAKSEIDDELMSFVQTDGIAIFQELVSQDPEGHGYDNVKQVERTEVGEGFKIHYIDNEKLRAANNQSSISSIVKASNEWLFFIELEGKPKSILTIEQQNDGYGVISAGGNSENASKILNILKEGSDEEILLVQDQGINFFVSLENEIEYVGVTVPNGWLPSEANIMSSEKYIETLQTIENDPSISNQDGASMAMFFEESQPDKNNLNLLIITLNSIVVGLVCVFVFDRFKETIHARNFSKS
ncbi:hypothetical protein SAMN05421736_101793 [Evansella caseinilytica]|uniref:Uncharacterized protein n=1 Tax=Evansella caseinilytica TaxID=1503961 RepID=A0A1H3IE35_9BACI|nr:hypothetical protein [Evansella caseinilytica]SDY25802.1 hypothetical protein SAMN05421736_101793 [Evansella caseinilytica]